MSSMPTLFVGTTREGLDPAQSIQQNLEHDATVIPWTEEIFGAGRASVESIVSVSQEVDFAAIVLAPDDLLAPNERAASIPRDGVLFELGLFMGSLGRERTFLVHSRDHRLELPNGLGGIMAATFPGPLRGATSEALAKACTQMREVIRKKGTRAERLLEAHPLRKPLMEMAATTLDATKVDSQVFRDEIGRRVTAWNEKATTWRDRALIVKSNYALVLLEAYRAATRSIFSTSVPEYLPAWETEWGRDLLEIQNKNPHARSTRVFLFKTRNDVTEKHRAVMETHKASRIEVLLHFSDEHKSIFPADLGQDWVVLDDGKTIGVTSRCGEIYEAIWYFHREDLAARFRAYKNRLREASEPFPQ